MTTKQKMRKRKKQLYGRILCAVFLIGSNLFWMILLGKQYYTTYGGYIENWQALKVHRKVIVLPENANVTIQTESGEVYIWQ